MCVATDRYKICFSDDSDDVDGSQKNHHKGVKVV